MEQTYTTDQLEAARKIVAEALGPIVADRLKYPQLVKLLEIAKIINV